MAAKTTNGHPIGGIKKEANGHLTSYKPPTPKRSSTPGRLFSIAARLFVWYAIFVALFQCPAELSELSEDSSSICKPYLTIRSYVSPYVSPYYERYLSSYAESARPYVTKLDNQVFQPTLNLGKKSYSDYLAPRVEQAQSFGNQHWEKTLKPHLDTVQSKASEQYSALVAPPLDKVSAAAAPYLSASQENVAKVYNEHLIPAYSASKPYAEKAYGVVNGAVVDTGYPYAKGLMVSSMEFLNRSLWPQLRILYGKNIEPQLLRISERLGRYRDGQKIKGVVEDVDKDDQSHVVETLQEIPESTSVAVEVESIKSSESEALPLPTAATEEEVHAKNREKIERDLDTWKEKFLKAADTGAEDLQERIKELSEKQRQSQVHKVGDALVTRLETTIASENSKLQQKINKIVSSLPEEPSTDDSSAAETELLNAVKSAKVSMKDQAQSIRTWKQSFIQETNALAKAASTSTLDVLDNVRALGLQEIGMRWANTEGVTWKDWQKYNDLKKAFDEWRHKVEVVASEHGDLKKTIEAAEEVESKGLSMSEDAAKELLRLKEVGLWKIQAVDDSEDFSTRSTSAKLIWAGKQAARSASLASIASALSESLASASSAVLGTEPGFLEQVSSSASEIAIGTEPGFVEKASSSISEAVVGTQQPFHESIASVASEKAKKISESVYDTLVNTAASSLSSVAAAGGSVASSVLSEASNSIIGSSQGVVESVASVASRKGSKAASDISEAVIGTPPAFTETVVASASSAARSVASDASSVASSVASVAASSASSLSSSASKVFAGAMAQEVVEQLIVLEDYIEDDSIEEDEEDPDDSLTEKLRGTADDVQERFAQLGSAIRHAIASRTTTQGSVASVSSIAEEKYSSAVAAAYSVLYGEPVPYTQSVLLEAQSRFAAATKAVQDQYSSALSLASAKISGTPQPVHEQAFASIQSAYSDSLAAASQRLDSAIAYASTGVYGTQPPAYQTLLAAVNDKYSAALTQASSQLEAAKTAVGATSTPGYESLLSEASLRYSSLVSVASLQHASATRAVSSYFASPTQNVLESISSVASSRLFDGLSVASAQYALATGAAASQISNVQSAVGATTTPASQQYLLDAQRRYYEAIGIAYDRYSSFQTSASLAVYGTPTPAYQSLYSRASEQIVGTPAPAYQNLYDSAQSQYSAAVSQASVKLDQLLAAGSSVANGPAKSLADSASSQYDLALSQASSALASATYAASTAIYGRPTGSVERYASDVSSIASTNWEALVSQASSQIYGAPTPTFEALWSQAGSYASVASATAAAQFAAVQSLLSELVAGHEPDFTESVMARLSSAYYTGAPEIVSSASSLASDAYASASSVVTSYFTPPPSLEAILSSASDQVDSAYSAASVQFYGSDPSYLELAQKSFGEAGASAQAALSSAIYGTTQGFTESVTSVAGEAYASVASQVSQAVYGVEEKQALESAGTRMQEIVEAARGRLRDLAINAGSGAEGGYRYVSEGVEDAASSVSSVVSQATKAVRDEL